MKIGAIIGDDDETWIDSFDGGMNRQRYDDPTGRPGMFSGLIRRAGVALVIYVNISNFGKSAAGICHASRLHTGTNKSTAEMCENIWCLQASSILPFLG